MDSCYYCNCPLTKSTATIDHLIPLARGGSNTESNRVWCCKHCNIQKGDLTPDEFTLFKVVKKNYKKKLTAARFNDLCDRLGLYRTEKKRVKRNELEYAVRKNLLEELYGD